MRCKLLTALVLLLSALPLAARQEQVGKPEAETGLLTRQVFNIGGAQLSINSAIQTAILREPGTGTCEEMCFENGGVWTSREEPSHRAGTMILLGVG